MVPVDYSRSLLLGNPYAVLRAYAGTFTLDGACESRDMGSLTWPFLNRLATRPTLTNLYNNEERHPNHERRSRPRFNIPVAQAERVPSPLRRKIRVGAMLEGLS